MKHPIASTSLALLAIATLGAGSARAEAQEPTKAEPAPATACTDIACMMEAGAGADTQHIDVNDPYADYEVAEPPCNEDAGETCMTADGTVIDRSAGYAGPDPTTKRLLHGFRIGAIYVFNHDEEPEPGESSLAEEYDIKSPWMFAIGYEAMRRIVGHSWLNVILTGNVTVVGLEQSKFIPTANGLVGFEFNQSFQLGVGANVSPEEDKPIHMIAAAGWTPKVGSFYMPVHFTLVPDVDGNHRLGSTVGVNW